MNRAARFEQNTNAVVNAYFESEVSDDKIISSQDPWYDALDLNEYDYFISNRASWLMENEDYSLVDAVRKADEEEQEITRKNMEWLADSKNRDSEIYSDIYKDVYGVRPRW